MHEPQSRQSIYNDRERLAAMRDEIDRDATLYVICHAGGRSQRVAQYLARNGFDPINVSGGMLSWVQAGRPVSSGS